MAEPAAASTLEGVSPLPGIPKPDPILVVDGVQRSFGGIRAVDVDHLEFQRGAITAIIGPNGAGKTTLFNVLTGFDRPNAGEWSYDGRRLNGRGAHRIAHAGMVRTFQLTKTLAKLTVLENMMLGAQAQSGERIDQALLRWRWLPREEAVHRRAEALLEDFGIAHMSDEYAGTLSGGQRKLLEMARALMTEPRLIMLDEPTAGVNPALTESLLDHISGLKAEGVTVVFVEHDMDVVMGISDWIVVMAQGRVLAEGVPDAVSKNEDVIEAYLGRPSELIQGAVGESP